MCAGRQELRDRLRDRPVLLVLDDVEDGHVGRLLDIASLGEASCLVAGFNGTAPPATLSNGLRSGYAQVPAASSSSHPVTHGCS